MDSSDNGASLDASLLAADPPTDISTNHASTTITHDDTSDPTSISASSASVAPAPTPSTRSTTTPEKSGWMQKNSYSNPTIFNSYFFVLQDNQLAYYVSEESPTPKGVIQLEGCSCEFVPESKYGLSACFELNSPLQGRLFALGCESQESMQQWINIIRSCMLKIRRAKAKEATAKKRAALDHAANESQAAQAAHREQQQALANAALTQPNPSPATSSASDSNAYANSYAAPANSNSSSSIAVQPNPNGSYNSGTGSLPQSSEDKYSIYRQWLDETKSGKSKAGGARGGAGSELHHTLLEEENKRKSTFEQLCGGCCPVWCFR